MNKAPNAAKPIKVKRDFAGRPVVRYLRIPISDLTADAIQDMPSWLIGRAGGPFLSILFGEAVLAYAEDCRRLGRGASWPISFEVTPVRMLRAAEWARHYEAAEKLLEGSAS